jgi:uncharacterized coiled-coil DUF342 family protein
MEVEKSIIGEFDALLAALAACQRENERLHETNRLYHLQAVEFNLSDWHVTDEGVQYETDKLRAQLETCQRERDELREALKDMLDLIEEHGNRLMWAHVSRIENARAALEPPARAEGE